MLLKGKESSVVSKSGLFSLKRCDTKNFPDFCKTDDEIDKYIKDLVVSVFAIYEEMDYTEYK